MTPPNPLNHFRVAPKLDRLLHRIPTTVVASGRPLSRDTQGKVKACATSKDTQSLRRVGSNANEGNHLINPKSLAAGDVVDKVDLAVKTASALIWARSSGLIKLGPPRQIFWHSHFKCVERDEELRSGCMCSGDSRQVVVGDNDYSVRVCVRFL